MQNSRNVQTSGSRKTTAKRTQAARSRQNYDAMLEDSMEGSQASGEQTKSVGSVIAQSLARESQETIDHTLSQVNGYIKATKDYATEKPGEAAMIAVTAGMATYVLLNTKPGRAVFDAAAERFIPEIARWISSNLTAPRQ